MNDTSQQFNPADWLGRSIRLHVSDRFSDLDSDTPYTLEEICGPDYWDRLNPGEQKLAGKVMKALVFAGDVPYRHVPGIHEYPMRYALIDGYSSLERNA